MFDDGPLRDWLHDDVRAVLDQHGDMDGTPFPSLAGASDAVEPSLSQLGIDWLYSSGLERKNRWGADESNRAEGRWWVSQRSSLKRQSPGAGLLGDASGRHRPA